MSADYPFVGENRYCVVFRSKRNKRDVDIDRELYEADAKAHSEAIRHGGLLLYWYGVPDPVTGVGRIGVSTTTATDRPSDFPGQSCDMHLAIQKTCGQSD